MSVQYDAQGRAFILSNGKKNYISPVAMGQAKPKDTTGMFRQAPQWNNRTGTWETPIDWTNIANAAVIGGLTAGAANAFMAAPAAASVGPTSMSGLTAAESATAAAYGGGTTASTVAGGAAGMAGKSWIADALFQGLPAIGNLWGTKMASDASAEGARIQAAAYDRGQRQLREMYDQDRADFAPYREAGGAAITNMAALQASTPRLQMPASVQARIGGSNMASLSQPGVSTAQAPFLRTAQPGVSAAGPVPMSGQMVTMVSPTGQTKVIESSQVAHYERLGARRVA